MSSNNQKNQTILFFGILIVGSPLFFDIYRTAAFNIIPHDDYVPYLLYLLGKEGGAVPGSPTGYRLLSVLIAAPFYYIIPLFKFSYLEGRSDTYLKALEALSFVNYLAISVASFLMYKITKLRFGGGEIISMLAALLSLLLFRFTAIYGVDPTAILLICLLIYHIENRWVFAGLLVLSIGFNEKIVFLFVMLFGIRLFLRRAEMAAYFAISFFAFVLYFLLRFTVDLPGHEYMVQPAMFFEKAGHTLGLLLTAKSMFLNWLPGVIASGLFYLAWKEHKARQNDAALLFTGLDFFPVIGFFIIAIITDMQFTIGRILLFCFPIYLPLATLFIERYFNKPNIGN